MPLSIADIAALSRLLDEAQALPPAQRPAWLDALPAEVQPLRPHLERMLATPAGSGPLASGMPQVDGLSHPDDPPDAQAGERVGPYRLLQEIGQGGMGTVWLAARDDGIFERQVALKLPRLSRGPRLLERMALERRIGALLEHPHIARLYDAGIDDRGRPYLVMERIQGSDLVTHCETARLPAADRVRLVIQACEAVAFAHRHLVVHRDIKPSNLMVDGQGQLKLLDFGIARLLDEDGGAVGSRSGDPWRRTHTPGYAAPEQRAGQPVTTATDLYSLGVVLHELLAGRRPEPDATDSALPALGPDLQAVLRRSLQPRPEDRYPTADALADDLRRVLAQRPVLATPATWMHRLRLFARRHRRGVVLAGIALVALVAGSGALWHQRSLTLAEAQRKDQARAFLADLLEDTEPMQDQRARDVTGAQMLLGALERARASFPGQPALRGDVLVQIGLVLGRLGQADEARQALREGATLLAAHAPARDPTLARARAQLALDLLAGGAAEAAEARTLATTALDACPPGRALCAKARAYALAVLRELARRDGALDLALAHAQAAVEANRIAFGADDSEVAMAQLAQATVLRNAGRLRDADRALAPARALAARVPLRAGDRFQLDLLEAVLRADLGEHAPAIDRLGMLLRSPAGAGQRATLLRLRAQSALALGLWRDARDDAEAALAAAEGQPFPAALARQALARALSALGDHGPARAGQQRVIDDLRTLGMAPDSVEMLRAERFAGELALRAGDLARAERSLAPLPALHGAGSAAVRAPVDLAQALDLLGVLARRRGERLQAVERHAQAAPLLAAALPDGHPLRQRHAVESALAAAEPAPLAAAVRALLASLPPAAGWRPGLERLLADPARSEPWVF